MKRWQRRGLIGLAVLAAIPAVAAAVALGPFWLRVERFEARPEAGYHADFFLYLSPAAERAAGEPLTLLVQPNNTGTTSDDPQVHRKDAWWTAYERHQLANELRVVLLVPAFLRPADDWRIYTHALDRDVLTTDREDLARLDLQLLAMVDAARASLAGRGLEVDERFLIQGFSASAMFANRMAVLHPERIKAMTSGAPGGWPIVPVAEEAGEPLPYPAGVADLEELTGKPFDLAAFRQIPQLLYLGSLDDNDSVDYRDGWDEAPATQIDRLFGDTPLVRWPHAERLFEQAGADATFLTIEGVGHDRPALQDHSTRFFAEVLGR